MGWDGIVGYLTSHEAYCLCIGNHSGHYLQTQGWGDMRWRATPTGIRTQYHPVMGVTMLPTELTRLACHLQSKLFLCSACFWSQGVSLLHVAFFFFKYLLYKNVFINFFNHSYHLPKKNLHNHICGMYWTNFMNTFFFLRSIAEETNQCWDSITFDQWDRRHTLCAICLWHLWF